MDIPPSVLGSLAVLNQGIIVSMRLTWTLFRWDRGGSCLNTLVFVNQLTFRVSRQWLPVLETLLSLQDERPAFFTSEPRTES